MPGLREPLLENEHSNSMRMITPQRPSIASADSRAVMMSPTRSQSVATQRDNRRRLLQGLWCTGVFLRMLTLINSFALLAAAGFVFYAQFPTLLEPPHGTVEIAARVRLCIELALPLLAGLFLFFLEWASACHEASARASVGFAFGASGRFALFIVLAVISLPSVTVLGYGSLECLAMAAAVCLLPVNALLQAWLLSCVPDFSKHTVAELNVPSMSVDSSHFPQIYQRDEGEFLHLGVLLPGFASRESCTMTANCSQIQLVGDIAHLDAPFSAVDPSNSTAGPFGPFSRDVNLIHPVDVTTPVESKMGLGILEFRFQKGYPP
ncbi:hypothetical protein AB1Y20_008036 [Prymnesium parvum]|mmetsp:Transcript_39691/g.98321  ORF Transcript_39691/g.98321 Transcript_39691/m.98321 type:complete len:322 (+) Transcript_39691:121-1086(+)